MFTPPPARSDPFDINAMDMAFKFAKEKHQSRYARRSQKETIFGLVSTFSISLSEPLPHPPLHTRIQHQLPLPKRRAL